ncbi:hypothetical protein PtrEW13061_000748 [Pyrenophora tritici-repentis]|nr:hypothetical protein PtrEW13061_000748 [Pyrenophora tritici-repentis]
MPPQTLRTLTHSHLSLLNLTIRPFHTTLPLSKFTASSQPPSHLPDPEPNSSAAPNAKVRNSTQNTDPQSSASQEEHKSGDEHPAKQPDFQEQPKRTTGIGGGEEVKGGKEGLGSGAAHNQFSVVVIPGVFEVLNSPTPPPFAWFKTLPNPKERCWGVYVVTLEKPGLSPLIYVGSATDGQDGTHARFLHYECLSAVSVKMEVALAEGFKITHKGLLASSSLGPLGDVLPLRSLHLVMEAAFAILFWAMADRNKDYGMPNICRWSLDTFEYHGLCGNSALTEGIRGGAKIHSASADDMAKRKTSREKRRVQKIAKYGVIKTLDPRAYRAARNLAAAKRRHDIDMGKHACKICDFSFDRPSRLKSHNSTQRHIDKLEIEKTSHWTRSRTGAAKAAKPYRCELCNTNLTAQ